MQVEELFKAFGDKSRLRIVASLLKGPKFVEQLSQELNIGVSTVSFHLKKLQAAGVVTYEKQQYYQVYSINKDVMNITFADFLSSAQFDDTSGDAFYRSVLNECFVGDRVEKLPVQIKKREIVYREILKKFSSKKGYSGMEVNVIIAEVTDEFVTARKEMTKLGMLAERNGKIYALKK